MKNKDSLYIANMDKAKTLDEKTLINFSLMQEYVFKHYSDNLKANILLSHCLDELKDEKRLDTSNIKNYIKHIERDYPIKKEMKEELARSKNNMTVSLIWTVMSAFVFLMFIKEALMNHYLIHLYIDSAIAVVAFYIMVHQLHMQLNIVNMNGTTKRPIIVMIMAVVAGAIVNVMASNSSNPISKFDFSFLVLFIGMFTAKKIFDSQFDKK